MNKDDIRKEFHEDWFVKSKVTPNFESILSYWLSKLDAYQSSLLERIEKMKPRQRGLWSRTWLAGFETAKEDLLNLIKEGRE